MRRVSLDQAVWTSPPLRFTGDLEADSYEGAVNTTCTDNICNHQSGRIDYSGIEHDQMSHTTTHIYLQDAGTKLYLRICGIIYTFTIP
jgi:hypothetical protein